MRAAAVLGLATMMASLGTQVISAAPAVADPQYPSSFVGVGSNTTQDLFNAFAGAAPFPVTTSQPTAYYTPLHSSNATGDIGIVSWEAVDPVSGNPGCLGGGAKPGFAEIDRPNGSGSGAKALSDANDTDEWNVASGCGQTVAGGTAGGNDATGQIDFARSSSGPTGVGNQLTFIPFARDGVTYLYFSPSATSVTNSGVANLTSTQLHSLFGTGGTASPSGTITVDGITIYACMMQSGSGTGSFWDTAMGNGTAGGAISDASAVNSGCGDTYEENAGNSFVDNVAISGSALTSTQVAIMPFSAGSWVGQANQVALDRSSDARGDQALNEAGLGQIDADGVPYTGTAPNEVPNDTFYQNTTYGRDLYVVLPTSKASGPGSAALKSLFVGTSSAICHETSTISAFGFDPTLLSTQTCGETGSTGGPSGTGSTLLEESYTQ